MQISLIVACSENRVIGQAQQLPWHLPNDLKNFKHITMGHPIVMGRKTYQSIGRPLPGRLNIVLTTDRTFVAPGCQIFYSIEQLLAQTELTKVMVIGGAKIYAKFLPLASLLYMTQVHAHIAGDTYFPELPSAQWQETARVFHSKDDTHDYAYSFVTLQKIVAL
jgi:dihydrofolate reductase